MSRARKPFSLAKPVMPKINLSSGLVEKAHLASLNIVFTIKSQKGVTMIEYALIAALVAVVAIGGITTVGTNLKGVFDYVTTKLTHP